MTPSGFAALPEPPYWAVVFTSRRRGGAVPADPEGYGRTAARMEELAADVPGYLGIESARDAEGLGVTVSYWASPQAVARWRRDVEHVAAQDAGRDGWYAHFEVRVARVERAYGWDDGIGSRTGAR